jgi:predicted SnoaL-like aldol condensation-catalyzing enzyme
MHTTWMHSSSCSHHTFRLVNGKVAEHWANRDDLGFLRQVTSTDG